MDYDFLNLGLPPIHPFKVEVKQISIGYSLYLDGEFISAFCSPLTLYYELVTNVLPYRLNLDV